LAKVKNKGGRPRIYTTEFNIELKEKLEKYIDETDIPIVAEFAYQNFIPRQKLYEFAELNDSIKRLIDKKETALERKGLLSNNTMCIFSLKQLGWKDNLEVNGQIDETELSALKSVAKREIENQL